MNKKIIIIVLLFFTIEINAQFTEHEIDKTELFGDATAIETGDIDGDGDIDVFISHIDHPDPTLQSYFTWYENIDGEGTYIKREVMDTDNKINVIVPIDFDNDGDLDVVTGSYDNGINWFENTDGSGTFVEHYIANEGMVKAINIIDFDGDNDYDIVFSVDMLGYVYLVENLGNETFGSPIAIYDVNDDYKIPTSIEIVDIDNDTDFDILISLRHAFYDIGEVVLLKNLGSGSFDSGTLVASLGYKAWSVKSLDVDADGDKDFVIGHDDNVSWFENVDGNGSFGTEQVIDNILSKNIQVSDIDSDGMPDIIVPSYESVKWYKNTGGSFTSSNLITADGIDFRMSLAAFINADSSIDIITLSNFGAKIAWYSNLDGSGNFGEANILTSEKENTAGVSVDTDNDGDLDVLVSSYYRSEIILYENIDGTGNFNSGSVITSNTNNPTFINLADIDGNAKDDLIVCNRGDNTITWYSMIYGAKQIAIENTPNYISQLFTEDIDNDGDVDIVISSPSEGVLVWYENTDGMGSFGSANYIISGNYPNAVAFSDIDNDTDLDILVAFNNPSTNMHSYNTYMNNGSGVYTLNQSIEIGVAPDFNIYNTILGTDMDGDGDVDLVGSHYQWDIDIATFSWYENTGNGIFGTEHIISTDWTIFPFTTLNSVDLDNDGDNDLVTSYMGGLSTDIITWYDNTDGAGNFSIGGDFLGSAISIDFGDFNNDTHIDILATDYEKIYWYENSGVLSINDVSSKYLKVSPNPTTNKITIESEIEISEIIIYNQLGQEVLRTNNSNEVDLSSLDNAIYFCHILDSNNNNSTFKIIKE